MRRHSAVVRVSRPVDVIVVDDDALERARITAMLDDAGCTVREVAGADEALPVVQAWLPDVVVVELAMPGRLSGVALARKLRDQPRTQHLGLIAVSAIVEPEWPIVRFFDAYLRRPLEDRLLLDVVVALAASARAQLDATRQSSPAAGSAARRV